VKGLLHSNLGGKRPGKSTPGRGKKGKVDYFTLSKRGREGSGSQLKSAHPPPCQRSLLRGEKKRLGLTRAKVRDWGAGG